MPVEFLCPHCRACMRIPDDAMGRETGCPKCHGKLTVPTVAIPSPEPVATLVDQPSSTAYAEPKSTAELPAFASQETGAGPFDFAAASDTSSPSSGEITASSPSATSRPYKRRKKKTGWTVFAVVGVVVAALLGGTAYLISNTTPSMNGTATATIIDTDSASSTVNLPPGAATERMVEELSDEPVLLQTDTSTTSFGAAESQLLISVTKTDLGQMVEVNLRTDSAVDSFLNQHDSTLSDSISQQITSAAANMVETVGTDPVNREAVVAYSESVGYTSLYSAIGPNVLASLAGVARPVVSEPTPGVLRWFLPRGTTSFEIIRNNSNPGPLPATFRYTATIGQ